MYYNTDQVITNYLTSFLITFLILCLPIVVFKIISQKTFTKSKAKLISILYSVIVFAIYFGILVYVVYTTNTYITPPNLIVFSVYAFINYKILSYKDSATQTDTSENESSDGAAAFVVMSADKAKELGLKPMAKVVSYASAGVDPSIMGTGPVPSSRKALAKAGLEVKDLEDQIAGLHTRIDNYAREIDELGKAVEAERRKIAECESLIERYSKQMDNVRNSREYDLLHKEVEFQTLEIELANKHIYDHSRTIDARRNDIAATEERLADLEHILGEKQGELNEIVSETRQEEESLRAKAKELETKVDERTLTAFKRIRKNARNGLGIVYVQRNACGGCFNRIPPQRQMEIRMHKKIIVCEYCGRIMIDPELAGVTTEA